MAAPNAPETQPVDASGNPAPAPAATGQPAGPAGPSSAAVASLPASTAQPSVPVGVASPDAQKISDTAHHSAIGRGVKNLMGALYGGQYSYTRNAEGGMDKTPMNKPGDIFRHILAGAIMGGAAAEDAHAKNPFISGVGGAAVGAAGAMKADQASDEQRREQANKDFDAKLAAEKNKREQATSDAEVQMNKARTAMTNADTMRINAESLGKTFEWHEQVAKEENAHAQVWDDAKISKIYDNISESEVADLMKKRPTIGHDLVWYHTGVRMVPDAQGNPQVQYTMSAYDPKGKIKITKGIRDTWERDGLYKVRPDLKALIDANPGYEMDAKDFMNLDHLDRQAYGETIGRRKDQLDLQNLDATHQKLLAEAANYRADREKQLAEAAKDKTDRRQSMLLADALKDLDENKGDLTKLKKSSLFVIGQSAMKMANDATAEGKAILGDATNYDDKDKQSQAQAKFREADMWRGIAASPFVNQPTSAAPPAAGAPHVAGAARPPAAASSANDASVVDKVVSGWKNTNNMPGSFDAIKTDPRLNSVPLQLLAASRAGVTVPWNAVEQMAQSVNMSADAFAAQVQRAGGKVEPRPKAIPSGLTAAPSGQ